MMSESSFTFHYVSISTEVIDAVADMNASFTFHYVSISTNVYIEALLAVLHLHSTMYLFQHQSILINNIDELLFTFHYVSIST